MASRPLRAAPAASTTSRLAVQGMSRGRESTVFQIGALRRQWRARVVACQKLWGSPFGHLFAQTDVGHRGGGDLVEVWWRLFLSSRIEHIFVCGNRRLSIRFRPLLGAASSGRRPWSFRHSASRTGRGTIGRRRVRVRVHSTLVLSRVRKDKSEPHLTQGESGPSSDPRTPRPRRSIKQKRRLR